MNNLLKLKSLYLFSLQDLSILVTSEWESTEVEFLEDSVNRCVINIVGFTAAQEWHLSKSLRVASKTIDKSVNNVKKTFPLLNVAGSAKRRPNYFIFNIILIMVSLL